MATGGSSAHNDLGFIRNHSKKQPNRKFYGAPSNISKKGMELYSETSRVERSDNITSDSIVAKRTDYLEHRERALTATLSTQLSEQRRAQENMSATTRRLAQEQYWMYGKTMSALKGLPTGGKVSSALECYRQSGGRADMLTHLHPAGKWVHVSYPQERVDTECGHQYLMKMKTVQPRTGQISISWAVVYEEINGKQHHVMEFATWPHS